jgi:transporter family-2 protein
MPPIPTDSLWLGLAAAAGAANGALQQQLGDGRYAAFFSICGTILTAVAFMVAVRPAPPTAAAIRSAPWWQWIGGPLGALFVLAGATLTPKVGTAAFITAVVGGQVICSLLFDHYGLMNVPQQGITAGRVLGGLMVFAGVLLVRYG